MNPAIREKYEVVIGIECHTQLATKTKLFCGCDNDSRDSEPNIHVCQVCLGLPGTLPVLNKRAVELALQLGRVLNATYPDNYHTKFDRKNYFYPDLPKGYQITQFDEPVVGTGWVEFPLDGRTVHIGITRAHLEEDAGKLTHPEGVDHSLVDLNRAGTPLLEIVSEPDLRSAAEAKAYAQELYNLVRYAGVSDANLYYGNMRFDVNVSVKLVGAAEFGTRSETKNLNSFKAIERVVEYETRRQIVLVDGGERVKQETRGWNDDKQETYSMRSKEDADEYRYFPEPDLPPMIITRAMVEAAKGGDKATVGRQWLQFSPNDVRAKLALAKIPEREAEALVGSDDLHAIWQWYNLSNEHPEHARFGFNWLVSESPKLAETKGQAFGESDITSLTLAMVAQMIADGKLSSTNAKVLLNKLWDKDEGALEVAQKLGLLQESNEDELGTIVDAVIASNAKAVEDYKSGNQRAFGALVGQAMKATAGKGNPPVINKLLRERLDT
jgi:aspartyl-tRNA(Asn)/glutamyl-tRNA(Gln) amidotransferase subunit B